MVIEMVVGGFMDGSLGTNGWTDLGLVTRAGEGMAWFQKANQSLPTPRGGKVQLALRGIWRNGR